MVSVPGSGPAQWPPTLQFAPRRPAELWRVFAARIQGRRPRRTKCRMISTTPPPMNVSAAKPPPMAAARSSAVTGRPIEFRAPAIAPPKMHIHPHIHNGQSLMESFFEPGFFDMLTPIRNFCACGNLVAGMSDRECLPRKRHARSPVRIPSSVRFVSDRGPRTSIPALELLWNQVNRRVKTSRHRLLPKSLTAPAV